MTEGERFNPDISDHKEDVLVGKLKVSMHVRDEAIRLGVEPQREGESDLEFAKRVQPHIDKDTEGFAKKHGIHSNEDGDIGQAIIDRAYEIYAKTIGATSDDEARETYYKENKDSIGLTTAMDIISQNE